MKMQPDVVFRCDATGDTGWGHVSRCLALAEAFRDRAWRTIVVGYLSEGAAAMVKAAGCELRLSVAATNSEGDLDCTTRLLEELDPELFVCDSYAVDEAYLIALKGVTRRLVLIDDFGKWAQFSCAAVLNFTMGAFAYPHAVPQRLQLLGPKFFPARRALRELRRKSRVVARTVRHVLVAMGGVDQSGMTMCILQALQKVAPEVAVRAVTGVPCADREHIDAALRTFSQESRYQYGLNGLGELYAWADACVVGGGLTKYESLFLGLPTAVFSANEGQQADALLFKQRGCVMDLGVACSADDDYIAAQLRDLIYNYEQRCALAGNAWRLFGGDTTMNVVDSLCELVESEGGRRASLCMR